MTGNLARGTLRTTAVLGLRLLVQSATLLVVARMLGPHQFGAFSGVAALAVLLGTLATCGTHLVLLEQASNDAARTQHVLAWAIPTTVATAVLLLGLYVAIATGLLVGNAVAIPYLLAIGVSEILAQPLVNLFSAPRLAREQVARSQLLQLIAPALRLLAAVGIWAMHLADPLRAYALAYALAAIAAYGVAHRSLPASLPSLRAWRLPSAGQLAHAASYAVLNITKAGPSELDKALATRLLPLQVAGVYSAAARIIGAVATPITALTLASLPRLFRHAGRPSQESDRLTRWMLGTATGYAIVVATLLWGLAPWIAWLFGPAYREIVPALHGLCLAVPALAIRMVAGNILMAAGRPWIRAGFESTGLLVLAGAGIMLAPALGTSGMVLAVVAAEWSMALLGLGMVLIVRSRHRREFPGTSPEGDGSLKGRP